MRPKYPEEFQTPGLHTMQPEVASKTATAHVYFHISPSFSADLCTGEDIARR